MTKIEELTTQLQDYIFNNEQKLTVSFDRVEEEMNKWHSSRRSSRTDLKEATAIMAAKAGA